MARLYSRRPSDFAPGLDEFDALAFDREAARVGLEAESSRRTSDPGARKAEHDGILRRMGMK